jgi:GT2 family glycosyltransferase
MREARPLGRPGWLSCRSILLETVVKAHEALADPLPLSSSPAQPGRVYDRYTGRQQVNTRIPEALSVSVVMCTYTDRRWKVMTNALEALFAQVPAPAQVIVVVDHSPELRNRVADSFPGATVLDNTERRGLSGARNTGIAHAFEDVVVFLDDDAIPADGWLAALISPYTDDHVVGTGGIAVPLWDGQRPAWLPDEFLWTVGCSYRGLPSDRRPVRNPIGATMAFRRSVFERVGGFTDGIGRVGKTPLGCEETEFSIRALDALPGSTIIHSPEATVAHVVTSERARWGYFCRRCWAEGLSKAIVTASVGNNHGLASERTYATRVLPQGVLRGLRYAIAGDVGGAQRAMAVLAGLAITTAGYARGWAARRHLG